MTNHKPMKYRKKPVIIVAMRYTEGKEDRLRDFIKEENIISWEGNHLVIDTLEGQMNVKPGNYVIRGVEGEVYPIQEDIFHKTYEPVEGEDDVK